MTPGVAVTLLISSLAALGSALCLLVALDLQVEEAWGARWCYGCYEVEEPELDPLDWEWRLRMAATPEAYWY